MNKGLGITLLVLDLLVMGLSAYLLVERVKRNFGGENSTLTTPQTSANESDISLSKTVVPSEPKETPEQEPIQPVHTSKSESLPTLKEVSFHYRDAIPKRVSIVGDFNQWSPQLMKKDKNHNWTVTLEIEPGEYAYNFIVDGRMIRDPSNSKTKKAGQKIPSSLLMVQE
jgi:hypothetical protein